jgi:hypothetical protein
MGFWVYWRWCGEVCLPERGGVVGLIRNANRNKLNIKHKAKHVVDRGNSHGMETSSCVVGRNYPLLVAFVPSLHRERYILH